MLETGIFAPQYEVFWQAVGALAQSVLALAALVYSVTTFRSSMASSHYSELDATYQQLLTAALERPHLIDPHAVRTPDQQREYQIYAFMIWNFIETIHDRCASDRHLRETWYPIIDAEGRLHRDWFEDPENWHRFKPVFRAFVAKHYPLPAPLEVAA